MITELARGHKGKVLDKWLSYLETYDSIFAPYQDRQVNILEIGIANGGSLDLWADYFPNAVHIVGCDINPECKSLTYDDKRISVVIGDANSSEALEQISSIANKFDIIIDDGSHINSEVIQSFSLYFPMLNYDGLYIAEDLHTSYWDGWGGGLHTPLSSMSFFKRLADMPNFEHWRISRTRKDYLRYYEQGFVIQFSEENLATIHSVSFSNSMAIIKAKRQERNKLGHRVVRGEDEHILSQCLMFDGTGVNLVPAEAVDDWKYDPFAMIQRINQLGASNDNAV